MHSFFWIFTEVLESVVPTKNVFFKKFHVSEILRSESLNLELVPRKCWRELSSGKGWWTFLLKEEEKKKLDCSEWRVVRSSFVRCSPLSCRLPPPSSFSFHFSGPTFKLSRPSLTWFIQPFALYSHNRCPSSQSEGHSFALWFSPVLLLLVSCELLTLDNPVLFIIISFQLSSLSLS